MVELSFMLHLINAGAGATSEVSSSCTASHTLLQQQTVQASAIVQMQAENQALQSQLYELKMQVQAQEARKAAAAQRRS